MKQVIVVNDSLKLPKGKLAAQAAHAAIASFLCADSRTQRSWIQTGMPKIVLKVFDENDLIELLKKAETNHIPAELIRDAGKTVVESGTITCLGLGPAEAEKLDKITGGLKLL